MSKLYVVPFLESTKEQIGEWCWGSCGHGIVGGIQLDASVIGIACRHEPCPHLDKEMTESCGDVGGEPVYLRKLAGMPGKGTDER